MSIRLASEAEEQWVLCAIALAEGQVAEDFMAATVICHEDYITDCPGYVGPVFIVHWGAAPDVVSVVWQSGIYVYVKSMGEGVVQSDRVYASDITRA